MKLETLIKEASDFARDNWKKSCGDDSNFKVYVNPGLQNGCKAIQLYHKGFAHSSLQDWESETIFAWHGTSMDAIPKICDEGFDPKLRKYG